MYVVQQIRRRGYVLRFSDLSLFDDVAPDRPGWRRHLPALVAVLALATIVLAFARPAVAEEHAKRDAVVVLALDTSLSMEATDVSPSRIDAAVDAANAFLDEVPEGVRVGLVTFDGSARVRALPAADIEAVRRALSSLELDEGTAIGEGLYASLAAIGDAEATPRRCHRDRRRRRRRRAPRSCCSPTARPRSGAPTPKPPTRPRPRACPSTRSPSAPTPARIDVPGMGESRCRSTSKPSPRSPTRPAARRSRPRSAAALTSVYEDLGKRLTRTTEPREVADSFAGGALFLGLLAGAGSLKWFGRLP